MPNARGYPEIVAGSPEDEAFEFQGLDAPYPHDIVVRVQPNDPSGRDNRCAVCGHSNHCTKCGKGGEGSVYAGHCRQDPIDRNFFYICEEPDRWAAIELMRIAKQEAKELTELRRLAAKYPDEVK